MTAERAGVNPEIHVELLWFADCPNHEDARRLLHEVLDQRGIPVTVEDIDATDPAVAEQLRFPGSPTIRVNGQDVAPGFVDPGDYAPRCRIYWTKAGPRGLPERAWIEAALEAAAEVVRPSPGEALRRE